MADGFGAFGKIPALGDFFRFGLSGQFLDPWDIWLQETIISAKATLGEAWQDAYMSAPIWRFSLTAGQMGPSAMIGVLMPSVDRVGRQFPLTLSAKLDDDRPALTHLSHDSTFIELENLALAALDDTMTLDTLKSQLAAVPLDDAPLGQMVTTTSSVTVTARDPCALLAASRLEGEIEPACILSADLGDTVFMNVASEFPRPEQAHFLFSPVQRLLSGADT